MIALIRVVLLLFGFLGLGSLRLLFIRRKRLGVPFYRKGKAEGHFKDM